MNQNVILFFVAARFNAIIDKKKGIIAPSPCGTDPEECPPLAG
jgi:hypothetical protein